jgi:hypothetical protein
VARGVNAKSQRMSAARQRVLGAAVLIAAAACVFACGRDGSADGAGSTGAGAGAAGAGAGAGAAADSVAAGDSLGGAPAPVAEALADSLLPRLERLSGLTSTRPLRIRSQSRLAVRAYVASRFEKELPPAELASIHDTYALLGLIPDTLDMRALLLDLYTEQVVGYYDPGTRTMYVLAGADAATLRPVLAHELVHALQDEHVPVDSLIDPGRGNDRQSAAHAALEGHATLVMFTLLAEDAAGRVLDPVQLPNPADQLRTGLETQNNAYPVFARAPAVIRETLMFPYVRGTSFVYALWSADPGTRHAAPLGDRLPQSTEQILHTTRRFVEQRDTPTDLRFARGAPAGWKVRREETLGELETAILLEHYLGTAARRGAEGWDGDRYRLLQDAAGARAFAWYSVWDDAASADYFAAVMRQVAARRPGRRMQVGRIRLSGREAVRIMDIAQGAKAPAQAPPAVVAAH